MFLGKREPEASPTIPKAVASSFNGSGGGAASATLLDTPRRPSEMSAPAAAPLAMAVEGKRLIVGEGISLSGEITACDRLIVEGSVKVTLNQTRAIEIAESGRFTEGKAEVEEAEISGVYEGELTVKKRLLIRRSGKVKGTVRYGEIEIEKGGVLSGSVSMLDGKA